MKDLTETQIKSCHLGLQIEMHTYANTRCLSKLKVVYLDGVSTKQSNISLVSLLEQFPSVKTLSLKNNSFLNKTVVAEGWCYLKNLEELNLNGNSISNVVTSCLEEEIVFSTKKALYNYSGKILDNLSGIDLSCNHLTSIITPELGNLSETRALNLSYNNLTGPIPSTFSKLKQIESLDLSYNKNGRIPSQLTELNTLEVFTVAHNNLSEPLPDMKAQFGTFDESSYEGNSLLCGPPLKKSCNEGDSPETQSTSSDEDEEHGFIDMGAFYISFAVSYGILFLCTVIVLYINPHWRRA
ncbi:hypothetical protein PTKIN_Ptkin09bG0272300 [Pterospermum kingtungense]